MSDIERLLAGLDPQQRTAVTVPAGPVLVLAGPGSGKTRVLTHRIAYLIAAMGLKPWQILAVTFTNKAAREMRGRLLELIGEAALGELAIGTFHAMCARILRREAEACGLNSRFVIFDQDDQLRLMRQVLREMEADPKLYPPAQVLGVVSRAKNELLCPSAYDPPSHWHEVAARAYERYDQLLRANNALDFDDLLLQTALLLRRRPDVCQRYQERYQYVAVDEFQDTNAAQYAILRELVAAGDPSRPHNLYVVGDEDQSIYRWRGADYRHVYRFLADFPNATTILLERNYRSTQNILDAARAVIDANPRRTAKRLWTDSGQGPPIILFAADDSYQEAEYVAHQIEAELASGRLLGHMAVMYRTNAQSRAIEEALLRHQIPYQLVGATRFYERREIRDLVAYLRLLFNPLDELALERIINVPPRKIGSVALGRLNAVATALGAPRWEALVRWLDGDPATTAIELDRATARALGAFRDLVVGLMAQRASWTVSELLTQVLERSGYAQWIRDGSPEGDERWENIGELVTVAQAFDRLPPEAGLAAFLESVALVTEADNLVEAPERVTLLTLHAAKGLEFPVVFLVGLEEGVLPHSRSLEDPEELAEERRLLYVGITRAQQRLYLVHARSRASYGAPERRQRSRFLNDLPPHVFEIPIGPTHTAPRATDWSRGQVGPQPKELLRAGDRVRHPTFGLGTVVASRLTDGDQEVVVAFEQCGIKKLLSSLARMDKLARPPAPSSGS